MLIFRQATVTDLNAIMIVISDAQKQLKAAGIDQWQNNYPNEAVIRTDIEAGNSYVLENGKEIIATVAFSDSEDSNYLEPVSGDWKVPGSYAVIHRIAIKQSNQGSGAGNCLMQHLEALARQYEVSAIRVDTHHDNQRMQAYLCKHGFSYCAVIRLQDGNLRDAFEKAVD